QEARQRYANLLVRGEGEGAKGSLEAILEKERDELDQAERALAAKSEEFRSGMDRSLADWSRVSAAVPSGAVLVGFVLCGTGRMRSYLAFIKSSGQEPVLVRLGSSSEVDSTIWRWTEAVGKAPSDDQGSDARRSEAECRNAGNALRKRLWDP